MNAHFQSLFENVCRCFGHTPTERGTAGERIHAGDIDASRRSITTVNSEASSVSGKRRTNNLKLNDKQYDELFDKVQRGSSTSRPVQSLNRMANGQPPRPEGQRNTNVNGADAASTITDYETAEALAQAKLAANPPRYRSKRKRPVQTREEIFRNKNGSGGLASSCMNGGGGKPGRAASASRNSESSSAVKSDFSRLLNPSLALCFATPIRGTEEEQEELDLKSLDHSDTATLNTNGDDTITSTLYFDSKYAHIQESTPPMPLFSQFKIGEKKDEIRTIMATDSHSSVRMIKIMEQNQQQQQLASGRDQEHNHYQNRTSATTIAVDQGELEPNSNVDPEQQQQQSSRSRSSRRMKDTITITSDGRGRDEEMEDAVPDVKPLSSSTDSSRLSNKAQRHPSIQ